MFGWRFSLKQLHMSRESIKMLSSCFGRKAVDYTVQRACVEKGREGMYQITMCLKGWPVDGCRGAPGREKMTVVFQCESTTREYAYR